MAAALAPLRALALLAAFAAAPAQPAGPARDASGLVAIPPPARVADVAGLLQPAERERLDAKLAAFEMARGTQVAIVIVPTAEPEPLSDYAQRVGEAWKIGRAGVGDGVLIAVSLEPRRIWISVARALEPALPDVAVARISREVIAPRFRDNDFAGGLSAGLDAIFRLIEGEALPPPAAGASSRAPQADGALALLVPLVLVGAAAGALLRRLMGTPGALLAGGGTGAVAGLLLSSLLLGVLAALAVLVLSVGGGRRARVVGGRGPGAVVLPGGRDAWSGGWRGGGWSSGGGWSAGGGGDFAGGGGGSDW